MPAGRPPKYNTPEEMQEAIDAYFDSRKPELVLVNDEPVKDRNGHPIYKLNPPTITGLAIHLGFVSRQSMYDYENRGEFSDTIKKARLRCENYVEEALLSNECQAAAGIFALKNYGWSDKHELQHSGDKDNPVNIVADLQDTFKQKQNEQGTE